MNDASTGAMQHFSGQISGGSGTGPAGLVLLYAEGYGALPAAFALGLKPMVLGRDPDAEISLPVTAVSRRHAEIRFHRGSWVLRDLGSTNGTLIDGQRIDEAVVEPNAEVRVGDAIFKLVDRGANHYVGYSVDGSMRETAERTTKGISRLIGGYQMDTVAAALEQVADSELSVLILGESGTGKEVAARELHDKSGRRGQFSAVNCAALPDNLIESELFGYKKGAFSGADRDKIGLIQAAHGGTLLLDEIGDMPTFAQAKLLRVLQSREVMPIGATRPEPVDVRVLAATHRDLGRLQREGKFRRDLFARLNEFSIELPPLRDRKEDIYQLARFFLKNSGRQNLTLSFPFVVGLLHHDWPYNIRELESAIKRAAALASGPVLGETELPEAVKQAILDYAGEKRPALALAAAPGATELRELLDEEQGNVAAVGRRLGKARMQVHRWMKRYGIEVDDYR
jgi:transcriptional regulator with PAS, ATPase and Fis domain